MHGIIQMQMEKVLQAVKAGIKIPYFPDARAHHKCAGIHHSSPPEEANYNMIDGLMNNTPKKKDKNASRRSVLKRLRKHQQKIASQGKRQPQQQKGVEEEMEREKK